MSLTKKDFIAIARLFSNEQNNQTQISKALKTDGVNDTIARERTERALKRIVESMADYCATQNANFQRSRFLKACGVVVDAEQMPCVDGEGQMDEKEIAIEYLKNCCMSDMYDFFDICRQRHNDKMMENH